MTPERLREIKTWAEGWRLFIERRYPEQRHMYSQMPLDVAVGMVGELVEALQATHTCPEGGGAE